MPRQARPFTLPAPVGGISRAFAATDTRAPQTLDAVNVLAIDQSVGKAGRRRIASRPGVTSVSGTGGTPYHWTTATWHNSGTKLGAAYVASDGAWLGTSPSSWTKWISTTPGTDFATVAVYHELLFMARGVATTGTVLFQSLTGAAGAGATISASDGGSVPSECGIVLSHGDRIWLAGKYSAPHLLFASKLGDHTAWDTAGPDADANPWASNVAPGGAIGDPITALVSHTEECLIIFCRDSTWVIRGEPWQSGPRVLSPTTGALMPSATAHDGEGNLWYMTRDGLYMLPAGCGVAGAPVSKFSLPEDLQAINPGDSGTYVSVAYDVRFGQLWITVDKSGGSNDAVWSFDLVTHAWFRHTFGSGPMRLGVNFKAGSTLDDSSVLMLPAAGGVSQFDRDSTESFDSSVLYGPLQVGAPGFEGIFHKLQASIASDSDDVHWSIFIGDTAEAAYDNYVAGTYAYDGPVWRPGLSTWQNFRLRTNWALVMPYQTGTNRICLEHLTALADARGLSRAIA